MQITAGSVVQFAPALYTIGRRGSIAAHCSSLSQKLSATNQALLTSLNHDTRSIQLGTELDIDTASGREITNAIDWYCWISLCRPARRDIYPRDGRKKLDHEGCGLPCDHMDKLDYRNPGVSLPGKIQTFTTEQLTDYIFVDDQLIFADAAIVFGITSWQLPVARAVELYRIGMAKKLIFTGGYNARIQQVEAAQMASAVIAAGIPYSDILIDPQATNTAENVTNALRCIEQSMGIHNVKSILLVAIHFHMRRVKLTVEKIFPANLALGTASYSSAFYTKASWHLSKKGRKDVYSELTKIQAYLDPTLSGMGH
jgi:uncharacterized SAM-binding protein YcdF (DUF218 family)